MNEKEAISATTSSGWRLKTGLILLVLSILLPLVAVPLVVALGLSSTMTASLSGVLLLSGEGVGILAIAVMGKPGYLYIKNRVFTFFKRYGPTREVSRRRYILGLVMFFVPILFGWVSVYTANYIPGFVQNPIPYAVVGDLLLIASLFVLGGNFWDKLRSLFVHDAVAQFPR